MRCIVMVASEYGYMCLKEIENIARIKIVGIVTADKLFELHYGKGEKKIMQNTIYDKLIARANELHIPLYVIKKMNSEETIMQIKSWNPEIIVVSGWYYLIGKTILDIPKYGVIGLHSSLLPKYRGGAPLVWQMINGEEYAGITLFYMDMGVDSGDIIAQSKVKIEYSDTIATLYEKVGSRGIFLLKKHLNNIAKGKIVRRKQYNLREADIYPQRCPEDGMIKWAQTSEKIYNFVRAQTKPYPGAFFMYNNYKVVVWSCEVVNLATVMGYFNHCSEPGKILQILDKEHDIIISTADIYQAIKVTSYSIQDENGNEIDKLIGEL